MEDWERPDYCEVIARAYARKGWPAHAKIAAAGARKWRNKMDEFKPLKDALRPLDPYDIAKIIVEQEHEDDAKAIARTINQLLREKKGN